MAGIYIHIPFCKQKCSYCNFHFSTNLNRKSDFLSSLSKEIQLRSTELDKQKIESIYLGGGTPSLLNPSELATIFDQLNTNYDLSKLKEITLEANPDDLTLSFLRELKSSPINRLSIGVQSFFDNDLRLMNRAHSGAEAEKSIQLAQDHGFHNLTIDLIYGSPSTSDQQWEKNIQKTLSLGVPHVSAYALTIEEKTLLSHQIKTQQVPDIQEDLQHQQFHQLIDMLTSNDFDQYEIASFGKKGFYSLHNSNYWKSVPYLGFGPSAHSFNGKQRSWNIANNALYIKSIQKEELPLTIETLTPSNRFNERIMLGLRTQWGVDLIALKKEFPKSYILQLEEGIQEKKEHFLIKNDHLTLRSASLFLADGLAASLFMT